MRGPPQWRAGFEIELILGDLGEKRFADYMDSMGPMDVATPSFCRAVAGRLTQTTGIRWSARAESPRSRGYYVLPEYDLDPLDWPRDRCAGVELLTPPLPLPEAEDIRRKIGRAIYDIDGIFNFELSEHMNRCAWHINVDAGDHDLDRAAFILSSDELSVLVEQRRAYTPYTATQRHAVGVPLLRHLSIFPYGEHLGLRNLLGHKSGVGKRFATNFSKLERGYVELRHFSSQAFLEGVSLTSHLAEFLAAFEVTYSQSGPFEDLFLRKFQRVSGWLSRHRNAIGWNLTPDFTMSFGELTFSGQQLGRLKFNGDTEISVLDPSGDPLAVIDGIGVGDIAEGVALLTLDLCELELLGLDISTANEAYDQAVCELSDALRAEPDLPPQHVRKLARRAAAEENKDWQHWSEIAKSLV